MYENKDFDENWIKNEIVEWIKAANKKYQLLMQQK